MNLVRQLIFGFVIFFLIFSLPSCRPIKNIEISYPPLDDNAEVTVFDLGDTIPENAEVLGSIAILNGFATKDNWENTLKKAKKEARAIGGNGLEIQTHIYPNTEGNAIHKIAAFILNIDDHYEPTDPEVLVDKAFNDYVVIREDDTLPCQIVEESEESILFVYDYNRQGLRRSSHILKDSLVSYAINDTIAFAEMQNKKSKKPFHVRFDVKGGYRSSLADFKNGPFFAIKSNFLMTKSISLGAKYEKIILIKQKHYSYIAGSVGYHKPIMPKQQKMDYYLDGACGTNQVYGQWISIDLVVGVFVDYRDYDYRDSDLITLGFGADFTYDIMLSKHFGCGIGCSHYLGSHPGGSIYGCICYYF